MAKQDTWPRITLRLPPDLHSSLRKVAGAGSLNAEIVARLEVSFSDEGRRLTPEQVKDMVELMMEPQREQIDAKIQVLRAEIDKLTNASRALSRVGDKHADD